MQVKFVSNRELTGWLRVWKGSDGMRNGEQSPWQTPWVWGHTSVLFSVFSKPNLGYSPLGLLWFVDLNHLLGSAFQKNLVFSRNITMQRDSPPTFEILHIFSATGSTSCDVSLDFLYFPWSPLLLSDIWIFVLIWVFITELILYLNVLVSWQNYSSWLVTQKNKNRIYFRTNTEASRRAWDAN